MPGDLLRPRVPCPIALGAIGVPAKRWVTRTDLFVQLESGRQLLANDPLATIEVAAKASMMSREHFLRMFQEAFGQLPGAYQATHRMLRARQLLVESTDPIWKVGMQCGYSDASAFSRAFRREFGLTPKQSRKTKSQLLHSKV
ncbi:MAG: helix-turn-helix transcriptional regulator [Chthonomonadaceae bacterium]|nr:helix-turn-helix transcriptional regulator [Chthonomonadaceae bacterium]